jgi:hypothetical protein
VSVLRRVHTFDQAPVILGGDQGTVIPEERQSDLEDARHSLTVRSPLPDASVLRSGLNVTDRTASLRPLRVLGSCAGRGG